VYESAMGVGKVHQDDDDTLDELIRGEAIGDDDHAQMLRIVQRLLHDDAPAEPLLRWSSLHAASTNAAR
jgi:hypothetical protein